MEQLLNEKIALVKEVDNIFVDRAKKRLNEQARPAGSLGILEGVSAKLAGIKKSLDIKLNNKKIIVCAGDHGVVEEGVSLFPQEVTPQMVFNFVNNGASINVLAKHAGASVCVADIGVNYDFPKDLKIFHKKVRKGTNNFTKNVAMTRDEAIKSILNGIEVVEEILDKESIDIIGVGDMGIGNTTPSATIISTFSGIAVEKLTGYGTGISDLELKKKVDVISIVFYAFIF
jgi:nicotinate-nucleotide--dimethylbenzimidazole phosphoribosyltransferase